MTEIVEYSLVVMVSTLFVAGSVVAYGSFSSFESGLQLRAVFSEVSGLASKAIESGTSSGTLTLPTSTIKCEGGSLSVTAGSTTVEQSVPVLCDFAVNVSGGSHVLQFSERSSRLLISVT